MYRILALALTLINLAAVADEGPYAPACSGCPEYTTPPYPHSGHWHNPYRSGTGINIDVQNGIVTAIYYGYRDDGTSVWFLASGELVQSEKQNVYWELEADLLETSNGEPVNGSYRQPDHEAVGTLHLEILQRHLIRLRIDEGAAQRMVPLMYGSESVALFEPDSDVRFPTFGEVVNGSEEPTQPYTAWLIVQRDPDGETAWGYGYSGPLPHWGRLFELENSGIAWYLFQYFDAPPHSVQSASIECGGKSDLAAEYPSLFDTIEGDDPLCIAWAFTGNPPDGERVYFMPIGNMGDRRFTAVSEDGWVMEGYRLGYD